MAEIMPHFDEKVTSNDLVITVPPFSPFGGIVVNGKRIFPGEYRMYKYTLTVEADKPVMMNLECYVPEPKDK